VPKNKPGKSEKFFGFFTVLRRGPRRVDSTNYGMMSVGDAAGMINIPMFITGIFKGL
jgi:hypothetical protein